MNLRLFYDAVRASLFAGKISQTQLAGINMILEVAAVLPSAQVAYILATSYWETGRKMQPVPEIGKGKGHAYGKPVGPFGHVYYGRGDVQLTWLRNYDLAGVKIGIDLVRYPDRALENRVSKRILVTGMLDGWFAGDKRGRHTLDRWINDKTIDFKNARRIINGIDKAAEIASIAQKFHACLLAGRWDGQPVTATTPDVKSTIPVDAAVHPLPDYVPNLPFPPKPKEKTMINTNMIHNILNLVALLLAALIGYDWTQLGLTGEQAAYLLATLLTAQNVLKLVLNVMRDGLLGLFKRQPPVVS